MVDGIHDVSATDHQKKPWEELIVLWVAGALSVISEEIIKYFFFLRPFNKAHS